MSAKEIQVYPCSLIITDNDTYCGRDGIVIIHAPERPLDLDDPGEEIDHPRCGRHSVNGIKLAERYLWTWTVLP